MINIGYQIKSIFYGPYLWRSWLSEAHLFFKSRAGQSHKVIPIARSSVMRADVVFIALPQCEGIFLPFLRV